jgi:hypothetical protein
MYRLSLVYLLPASREKMNLNEMIIDKLKKVDSTKTYVLLPEVDLLGSSMGSSVRITLMVNGQRTAYGFYPNVIRETGLSDDEYSSKFVHNIKAVGWV